MIDKSDQSNTVVAGIRRVAVTGLGMVSPLAIGVEESWRRLLNCESGVRRVISFEVNDIASQIAGQVPAKNVEQKASTLFDPLDYINEKELRRIDTFILYAIAAADQAVSDAGLNNLDDESRENVGVIVGSGIGGLPFIYDTAMSLQASGPRRVSPFFIPASLINLASGHVSIRFGFKGPNHSVVTACATGTHAIGDAARIIQVGAADVMVCGGAEAAVCRLGMAGFAAARALSTCRNNAPEEASRPWDKSRDGFVIADGAGILILEELEHAKRRGAKIYGEVVGYGMSGDAYHVTAPSPDGNGAYRSMMGALRLANISPDRVDYINAHGTSTAAGDITELRAVEQILGNNTRVAMSSTKSSVGHMLGAAGAVEAIFSLLAIRDQIAPPTLNLHDPEETFIDLVPLKPKERKISMVMSNSFGFGGTNATLIFRKSV
ncbi:MAG: beta-ketoacyl-ACP synthase II [Holosporaceae bacterium]|jgi:3-oxoacyl-[acyl-carrier-protein] synthase II|nr:beta-ketoacyl-ACP synthase II [Holosporaceae bacterium]